MLELSTTYYTSYTVQHRYVIQVDTAINTKKNTCIVVYTIKKPSTHGVTCIKKTSSKHSALINEAMTDVHSSA